MLCFCFVFVTLDENGSRGKVSFIISSGLGCRKVAQQLHVEGRSSTRLRTHAACLAVLLLSPCAVLSSSQELLDIMNRAMDIVNQVHLLLWHWSSHNNSRINFRPLVLWVFLGSLECSIYHGC